MSEQIVQSLGFDATAALASLSQIDGALASLEGHLQRSATLFREFNAAGNQTSALLSRLANNANKAAQAFAALNAVSGGNLGAAAAAYNNLGNVASSAATKVVAGGNQINAATASAAAATAANVGRMTTSLQLLSRIAFTQAVVRALSTLRNELKDTTAQAVEFQKSIALTQTIDQSGQSADQLKNSVKAISDAFNIPLLEVSAGLYQTISNQIGEAGESLQFLNTAAKFARATNSSLSDSVDLLSGALKSFNLDISQADRVAGVFFKSIDLGGISADRLANTFGRVGPQSALAGLSIEEFGAAVAAISEKGTNANEALTQYRGIVTALQKPTVALQQAVEKAGFSSVETAVSQLKLVGTLQLLKESAAGSSQAMASFFPNVRGLGGAAALTGDDLQVLIADLEEMQSVTGRSIDDKFLTAIGTDAEKVTSDINKLKNALTTGLGQELLRVGVEISDFVGGVDSLSTGLHIAAPFVVELTGALTLLAAEFGVAKLAGVGLSTTLGLITAGPIVAHGLGKSLADFLDTKEIDEQFKKLFELIKQNNEQLDVFKDAMDESAASAKKADDERIASAVEATKAITAAYNDQVNEAQALNKSLVRGLKSDADDIIGAYRKLSTALGSALADAQKSQQEAQGKIQSLQAEQANATLQAHLAGLNDAQKIYALSQRSAQLAAQAATLIASSSGNDVRRSQGEKQADLAKQLAEQEVQLAKQTGDRGLQAKAANDLASIQNTQIAAEERLIQAEQARASKIAQTKSNVDKITKSLQEQFKVLLDNSGALDKNGKKFSAAEEAQRAAAREAASNNIAKLTLSNADTKQLAQLGLGAVAAKLASQLTVAPLKLAFDADQGIQRVKDRLTKAFADFKLKLPFDLGQLEQAVGKSLTNPDEITKGLQQLGAEADKLRQRQNAAALSDRRQTNFRDQLTSVADQVPSHLAGVSTAPIAKDAQAITAQFVALSQQVKITDADLKAADQAAADFNTEATSDFLTRNVFSKANNDIAAMLAHLHALAEAQKTALDPAEAQAVETRLKEINSALGTVGSGASEELKSAASAMSSAVSPAETIARSSQTVRANYEAAAQALIRASQSSAPGGQAQGLAKGGLVRYYADGGFTPRGTDTIPAMLSPGEFVVNAASTRKFYAQLVAMNAGQSPIYRAAGGPTTIQNITIGDIHLVNERSKNPGRAVVDDIRRELRRSTSKL